MKVDVQQLKDDSINAGGVVVGMMASNAVSQVIPVQNQLIKSSIPLAGGLIGTMAAGNSCFVKNMSYGAMAFGALSLVRTLLVGQPTAESTNGVNGIGDNPTVQKLTNLLIPSLGSTDEGVSVDTDMIDEFDFNEEPYEFDNDINGIEENAGSFLGIEENSDAFLSGIEENEGAFLSGSASYEYDPYKAGNNY